MNSRKQCSDDMISSLLILDISLTKERLAASLLGTLTEMGGFSWVQTATEDVGRKGSNQPYPKISEETNSNLLCDNAWNDASFIEPDACDKALSSLIGAPSLEVPESSERRQYLFCSKRGQCKRGVNSSNLGYSRHMRLRH